MVSLAVSCHTLLETQNFLIAKKLKKEKKKTADGEEKVEGGKRGRLGSDED